MALKSSHRVALTTACLALAAIIALPSRPYPEEGEGWWPAVDVGYVTHYDQLLSRTLGRLRWRVRAARMADSLLPLIAGPRALHSADSPLTVLYEQGLSPDSARTWLRMLEAELSLVPRGRLPGMPLVVALRSSPEVPGDTMRHGFGLWRAVRFVSPRPDRPACIVAMNIRPDTRNNVYDIEHAIRRDPRTKTRRTNLLNQCAIYARFGSPGVHVRNWVGGGVDVQYWWGNSNMADQLEAERRPARQALRTATWDPAIAACVRNGGASCLRIAGLARAVYHMPYWFEEYLLASLLIRDPAGFEAFWRSADVVGTALEHAYGQPAAEVIAVTLRRAVRLEPSGPRTPSGALLSSLGWAAIAMGLGIVMAGRQQVKS